MSSAEIRSKIKSGLARAATRLQGSNDEMIYVVKKTKGGDLLDPTSTEESTELVNAIFSSLDTDLFDGDINATDRQLISDYSVTVNLNDKITQGDDSYIVVDQDIKKPLSEVLLYISRVRKL